MLRWMAPFLSFTAEEAWATLVAQGKIVQPLHDSIFLAQYAALAQPDEALNAKWARVREMRDVVNKEIEVLRGKGLVGSSLQAHLTIECNNEDFALLQTFGLDLRFIFITSKVTLVSGDELRVTVATMATMALNAKCERCWHYPDYPDHVGCDPVHPTVCGRCVSNLFGAGETRTVA
jgi:isoleucyl-tRNA synthetase